MASKKKKIIIQGGGSASGVITEELEGDQINTEISASYNETAFTDLQIEAALAAFVEELEG